MKPEVWDFIKWQIGVGIAFFSLVVAWLALADKWRKNREEKAEKVAAERDQALKEQLKEKEGRDIERDKNLQKRIETKEQSDLERWGSTDREVRALQKQMQAMEVELARNYTRREQIDHTIEVFSERMMKQFETLREEVSSLTRHLLEQRKPHDTPRRR